jgi:cytosine/uracil/thiamine/allantoin permease
MKDLFWRLKVLFWSVIAYITVAILICASLGYFEAIMGLVVGMLIVSIIAILLEDANAEYVIVFVEREAK